MFLPPLARRVSRPVIDECFNLMDSVNDDRTFSRIENIPAEQVRQFSGEGFVITERAPEYIYDRAIMASLNGAKLKAKRAAINQLLRSFQVTYVPYNIADRQECELLRDSWANERLRTHDGYLYRCLLEDTCAAQEVALRLAGELGLAGRLAKSEGRLIGYTFGYALNEETWCVVFEVCDHAYRGLSQYLFKRFCAENYQYRLINAMDDSGLENLRRVKHSYQPREKRAVFSLKRGK